MYQFTYTYTLAQLYMENPISAGIRMAGAINKLEPTALTTNFSLRPCHDSIVNSQERTTPGAPYLLTQMSSI